MLQHSLFICLQAAKLTAQQRLEAFALRRKQQGDDNNGYGAGYKHSEVDYLGGGMYRATPEMMALYEKMKPYIKMQVSSLVKVFWEYDMKYFSQPLVLWSGCSYCSSKNNAYPVYGHVWIKRFHNPAELLRHV